MKPSWTKASTLTSAIGCGVSWPTPDTETRMSQSMRQTGMSMGACERVLHRIEMPTWRPSVRQ
jgi:hypothetical protein